MEPITSALKLFENPHLAKECDVIEVIVKETLPSFLTGWEVCSLARASRSWKQLLKKEFLEAFRKFEEHSFLETQIPKNFHSNSVFEAVEAVFLKTFLSTRSLARSIRYAQKLEEASLEDFPQVIEDLNLVMFCRRIPFNPPLPAGGLTPYAAQLREWIKHSNEVQALVKLDLSNNGLTVLPKEIERFIGLQELDLANNKLTALPDSIQNLTHLRVLQAQGNQLHQIPDGIGKLTQLIYLMLSNNQLQTLPDSMENLTRLSWLSLSKNQIQDMPHFIKNLRKLDLLDLSHNQLKSFPQFSGFLSALRLQVRYLDFSKHQKAALLELFSRLDPTLYIDISNHR